MNHQTSMFNHETQIPRSPFASTLTLVFHAVLGLAVVIVTAIPSIPKVHKSESLTFMVAEAVPDLRFEVPPPPAPLPKPPVEIPRAEPPKAFEAPAIEKPAPIPTPPAPAPEKKAVIEPPREVPVPKPVNVGAFAEAPVSRVERKAQVQATDFDQANAETSRVKRELQSLDALDAVPNARTAAPKGLVEDSGFGANAPGSQTQRATLGPVNAGFGAEFRSKPAPSAPQAAAGPTGFNTDAPSRSAAAAPPKATGAGGFGDTPTRVAAVAPRPVAAPSPVLNDTPPPPKPAQQAPAPPRADRPVEVVYKPSPAYTDEARTKRVEGEVTLEVEFTADGKVRVLRVVHGLGYGLDEMAQRAAEQIRFKPATSRGTPVDFRANLTIVFRLT
jgi:TonB family protein